MESFTAAVLYCAKLVCKLYAINCNACTATTVDGVAYEVHGVAKTVRGCEVREI